MRYRFLMIAVLAAITCELFAQQVKGKIIDADSKEPLEYVNVALFKEGNAKLVKGSTTGEQGGFELSGIEKGNYELRISFVGYTTLNIPVALTAKKPSVNLGNISLSEDSKQLKEVQITGQRSQMKFEVDKKVFNVDQNIASAGASASEALSNIPSVTVDNEGNVSLRNNSSVTIWINGRPSGLSEDNRAQILEQLPAESIESIEIITNPSSRFSAEGSAGIINIVMKKEKKTGYFGGVSANADSRGGYGASANINMTYNKIEGYVNMGYRNREMKTTSNTDRTSFHNGDSTFLSQKGKGEGNGGGFFTRMGLTYNFSKKDVLSFSGSGMWGNHDRTNNISYYTLYPDLTEKTSSRHSKEKGNHDMLEGSVDYIHTFSKNSDLRAAVSYDYMNMGGTSSFTQKDPLNTYYQLQDNPRFRKNWEFTLDYTNAWENGMKVEAGYKGVLNKHESETTTWNDLEKINEEISLYNDFTYNENIQAFYATLSGKVSKFNYMAGVRGEYTHYTTGSAGKEGANAPTDYTQNYFDLFPSAFVSYALPKGNELQLNYTRRINRPRGRQLNPFKNISDSANISFGNPYLLPEFTDALELNYIKNWENHMLSASLYYRTTDGVSQRVSYLDNNTLYTTYDNVTDSRRAGMELVGKNRLFGWLDLTSTVNLYYYKMNGFDYRYNDQQTHYKGNEDFSWDARVIANAMLPWNLSLQITGNYNSATYTPQGKNFESYWLDAGIRRSFLERRLSVAITGRDLLDSRKRKSYTYGDNFFQTSTSQWGGRQVGISISYNFGNMKSAKKKQRNGDKNDSMEGEMMDY
ncbi:MAG: outer membrane beta-barrel family protein [Bacteroidales bacterium]